MLFRDECRLKGADPDEVLREWQAEEDKLDQTADDDTLWAAADREALALLSSLG